MKKSYLLIMILSMLNIALLAENKTPDWVSYYIESGTLQNQYEYYFGIGNSTESQIDADNKALEQFGRSIETEVKGQIKSSLSEKNGKVNDQFETTLEISSDVGLRGVSITGKFEFDGKFYSIIQYLKEDYNKILKAEITRDIERKQLLLEEEKEKNRLAEEAQKENLRKEQEKLAIKKDFSRIRRDRIRELNYKYSGFFKMNPPSSLLSFSNAQVIPTNYNIQVKAKLNELALEDIHFAYKKWLFEFSLDSKFFDNEFHQQEFRLKYQILPYSGNFFKLSAAFGVASYFTELEDNDILDSEIIITPFIVGNLTLADLKLSFLSIYADAAKTNIGISNYLFYGQLKDRVSLIIEMNILYSENVQNQYGDLLVFQPGLRFKTTANSYITFSYEDNNEWNANLSVGF